MAGEGAGAAVKALPSMPRKVRFCCFAPPDHPCHFATAPATSQASESMTARTKTAQQLHYRCRQSKHRDHPIVPAHAAPVLGLGLAVQAQPAAAAAAAAPSAVAQPWVGKLCRHSVRLSLAPEWHTPPAHSTPSVLCHAGCQRQCKYLIHQRCPHTMPRHARTLPG